MSCERTSIHVCCCSVSAVWDYNRRVRRWNIFPYHPGGTPPRRHAVRCKVRYCVRCGGALSQAHPSPAQQLFFHFFSNRACLPARAGLCWIGEDTGWGEQTNPPRGCVASLLALLHLGRGESHMLGLQPGRSTGLVSPARVQSTSPFKLLELGSPPWTREGFLYDLPAHLHHQTGGSPFSKKYLMFSCWFIWAGIFFFQVPFPKYLILKTFFFWCGK